MANTANSKSTLTNSTLATLQSALAISTSIVEEYDALLLRRKRYADSRLEGCPDDSPQGYALWHWEKDCHRRKSIHEKTCRRIEREIARREKQQKEAA